jgi:Asp-tRNA(Asn)/Glu-tRNA(Gln) amidotransferase B subunit
VARKLLQSTVEMDLYRAVEQAAKRDARTVSSWIRMQVLRGLEAEQKQKEQQMSSKT